MFIIILCSHLHHFIDGKKYRSNKSSYYNGVRKVSDDICKQYNLSIIEPNNDNINLSYSNWLGEKTDKVTWRTIIKHDIDAVIKLCETYGEFLVFMELHGYMTKDGKYLSFKPYGKERFVRGKTLGSKYTKEYIKAVIEKNDILFVYEPQHRPLPPPNKKRYMSDLERSYWRWMYDLNLVKREKRQGE